MRKILTTLLLCAMTVACMAQKLQFSKLETLETSAEAKTNPRLDRVTEENCALMHVYAPNIQDYIFEGKLEGEPIYKNGEAILYLRPGSFSLTVKHNKYGTAHVEFSNPMQSEKVYSIRIDIVNNKIRTLVMPVAGIGKAFSYGIMVGLIKTWGGYLKGKYSFHSVSSDLESNAQGYTSSGNEIWFNGETDKSRLSVTGGVLYKVKEPLLIYGGLGYGNYTYARQTSDLLWAKNTDASVQGVEAEVGVIGRWKNLTLGVGVETCQFKYWELNAGIGVIF